MTRKRPRLVLLLYALVFPIGLWSGEDSRAQQTRPWEMIELSFQSETVYDNPYVDVDVWVDWEG